MYLVVTVQLPLQEALKIIVDLYCQTKVLDLSTTYQQKSSV